MAAAPPAAPAPPPLPPTAFLMALKGNENVSAACVAGVDNLLLDATRAQQADFFSGRVKDGLNLLLPEVLRDVVFAQDKRKGIGELLHSPPLFALGVPDSCGYLPGMHYCQVDTINVFVKWGVCVPRECGIEDVKTAIFPPITEKLADRSKGVCGPLKPGATLFVSAQPLSPAAASTLAFLALLLLAVLAATVVDVYGPRRRTRPRFFDGTTAAASTVSSHSSGSSSGSTSHGSSSSSHGSSSSSSAPILTAALVQSFSLSRNYDRLAAPPRPGPFLCLEAVRVLAMGQVILGHTLWFLIHVSGIGNPREMLGYQNRGLLSTGVGLIANSSLYGVDAFFAIAGFLAVLLFMEELHKRVPRTHGPGQRTALFCGMAVLSWIRRYLRLTPAFAVVLWVFITLTPYLDSAPPSPTGLGHEVALCREKWWQNVLYVNNLLSDSYDMCYIPSWWLAAINQLFLLVPAISLVAFWRPRAGIALCLLACLGSYLYSLLTGQREEWRLNAFMRPGFPNFFNHFYIMPWTRLPTFALGCVGAILWRQHGQTFTAFMHRGGRYAAATAWAMVATALVLLGLVVFGPQRELGYIPGKWTQAESSLYITLSMSAWALGLALVCAVLFSGQGGPLKILLELPFWSVLARLVYATYLVHPMVIWVILASRGGEPYHFSLVSLFSEFVGFASMSVLTAFLFYFLVEGPLAQVERLIFKGPKAVVNHGKTHEEGEREVEARKEGGEEAMKEKGGRERSEGGVVVAVAVSDAASEDSTVVMMKAVQ